MKLSFKKPQNLRKKRTVILLVAVVLAAAAVSGLVFTVRNAQALADDDNFRVAIPYYGAASQGTDVYLEISQTGNNNTLDAPEAWAKVYIEPSRINDTTIGIYRGGYANGVDSQGPNFQGQGSAFPDDDSTNFEFIYGRELPNGDFSDEGPCRDSFATKNSGDMSSTGWYKIDMSRFSGGSCGSNKWKPTQKSGKYVVFVKATWRVSRNPIADGRLNAFKVSAAYENPKGPLDNPLTGYWSNYSVATNPALPGAAAYSVQDRKSPDGTRGDYTFRFAPDCRIPQGETDKTQRYLHWKDVDYPDYYQDGGATPSFDMIEISPSGARRTMTELHVDKNTLINGASAFGQNKHAALPFKGKGGYKYEWTWKNITRVDGVSFWLPYDDFPALNNGCGNWGHELKMKAGPDEQYGTTEFRVGGGQTASINLTQNATGDDAGPATDLDLTVASTTGTLIASAFSGVSATLSGGTSGASTAIKRVLHWEDLDPIGGAYPLVRNDIYARFVVADNAPDGARFCASAVMSPKSSTQNGGTLSTPNQICFVIDNSLKPYVTTSGADVHAGSCNLSAEALLGAKIIGPDANGGSKGSSGSYIVSAGDAITNFGSGGTPGGLALTFGRGGKYGGICRPSVSEIEKNFNKDTATPIIDTTPYMTGGNFDLGRVPADGRYKVSVTGSFGVVGKSKSAITIYNPTGSVALRGGSVGADTAYETTRAKLPVVGIVAKSIAVSKDTTTINAVIYATDGFNTCSISDWVNQCKSTLTLNGFAMAGNFLFRRTTPASNGLQEGEKINFNAAYYLNPPPGFGVPANMVKYLGEKAPLF